MNSNIERWIGKVFIILFILCTVTLSIFVVKALHEVERVGLKAIVERIWEGESKGENDDL